MWKMILILGLMVLGGCTSTDKEVFCSNDFTDDDFKYMAIGHFAYSDEPYTIAISQEVVDDLNAQGFHKIDSTNWTVIISK